MIDDVIRAFEGATEGSRDLSDEFLLATGWQFNPEHVCPWRDPDGEFPTGPRPDPSRNLQHAADAVPPGYDAFDLEFRREYVHARFEHPDLEGTIFVDNCRTGPLAACLVRLYYDKALT